MRDSEPLRALVGPATTAQARGTIGIFYTWLGQDGFRNVDWR